MIYAYSLHLALSHVFYMLSSLNHVSVSPVAISIFLHFYYFFPPHSSGLLPFKSILCFGITVYYFLPYCLYLFCWSNLIGLLGISWYILSGFIQLLRYNLIWILANTILFLCLLSSPKQRGIFEHPRSFVGVTCAGLMLLYLKALAGGWVSVR